MYVFQSNTPVNHNEILFNPHLPVPNHESVSPDPQFILLTLALLPAIYGLTLT